MRDNKEGPYLEERKDNRCDHVLTRRSLRVKPPTSFKLERTGDDKKDRILSRFQSMSVAKHMIREPFLFLFSL